MRLNNLSTARLHATPKRGEPRRSIAVVALSALTGYRLLEVGLDPGDGLLYAVFQPATGVADEVRAYFAAAPDQPCGLEVYLEAAQ